MVHIMCQRSFVVPLSTIFSLLLLLVSYQNCGGTLTALHSANRTSDSLCEENCSSIGSDGNELPGTSDDNEGDVNDSDPMVVEGPPGDNGGPTPPPDENEIPVVPPGNGNNSPYENQWQQVVKRTQVQKAAGLLGGEGGQMIFGLTYAPSDPNIAYFVTDTTRVWKSTDGGTSWHLKSNGIGATGGISVVIHPTNPDIVYIAGGNISNIGWTPAPDVVQGIFRTTNGGNNWTLIKNTEFVRKNSGGAHIVFAGSNMYAAPSNTGILKSVDDGNTWNFLMTSGGTKILNTLNLTNISVHPKDNAILFVSSSNGLYKVVDNGGNATVTKIGAGLPLGVVYQLVINPNTPDVMYLAAGTNGVWKSTDGGLRFTRTLVSPIKNNTAGLTKFIAMSPVNPNRLIVTFGQIFGKYLYYTSNGGTNWTQTSTMDYQIGDAWVAGSLHGWTENLFGTMDTLSPIVFHPQEEDIALVVGWGDTVCKTMNGGESWKYSNTGYTGTGGGVHDSSSAIGWDSTNYHRAVYTHADWGSMVTEDNEDTFTSRATVKYNNRRATAAAAMYGDIIVQAVGQSNNSSTAQIIAISRDAGANWTTTEDATAFFKFIEFHPQNKNIVYAGNYKFTNIQVDRDFATLGRTVASVFWGNGNIVYSYSGSTIYKSINAGITWTTPYPSLNLPSGTSISQMAVSPTNADRIYAAVRGKGIYIIDRTTASGGTVVLKNHNDGIEKDQFGEINVKTVATDPNNANIVYAGTRVGQKGISNGVFRSVDGGNTWTNITRNTFGTMFAIQSIKVRADNSYVYISTMSGTWKLPPPPSSSAAAGD